MVSLTNFIFRFIALCMLSLGCICVPHEGSHEPSPTKSAQPAEVTDHRYFLKDIFSKYGNGGQMTFEGFEHLLESLGLGNIIIKDHDLKHHKDRDDFKDTHDTHEHSPLSDQPSNLGRSTAKDSYGEIRLPLPEHKQEPSSASPRNTLQPLNGHGATSHSDHHHYHEPPRRGSSGPLPELLGNITSVVDQHRELNIPRPEKSMKQCLSPLEMLMVYNIDMNKTLDPSSFIHLCPVIVWELEGGHCTHSHEDDEDSPAVTMQQWMYSILAVVIISLCGLFSVAVIPIMQKWFYHTLLQYLVGLAIGSLSGDALLHLMPHALEGGGSHDHGNGGAEDKEGAAVWKGMAALGGIYFFFIAERCLNALTVYKSKRKAKKNSRSLKLMSASFLPVATVEGKSSVGEKLSQYRKGSYVIPNGTDGKETAHMLPEPADEEPQPACNGTSRKSSSHSVHEVAFHGRSSFSAEPNVYYHETSPSENYVVTVSDHHGHGHGHSHEVPKSISAVAWMVIMGDGLHNFCDGLAIGTAFASGVPGGISTAVAVFCHELPHELGDFAMLLKTGMKVKQALLYNGLSSILCFLGMVIGVSLGNVDSATAWVFSITAGMFLYIALVDMLPELSAPSNEPGSTASYQLAVQVLGISTGVSIMLIIANYEHELERLVS